MSFTRVNLLGWALFEELTSAQMNQLDIDHAAAIDGGAGGTYAPTNPIIIGGDGLEVTGPFVKLGLTDYITVLQTRRDIPLVPFVNVGFEVQLDSVLLQNTVTGPYMAFHLAGLPHFGTLTGFTAVVEGGTGHSGLPGIMPQVSLQRRAVTLAQSSFASYAVQTFAIDGSADVPAYQLTHNISASGLTHVMDDQYEWALFVTGEQGANSLANQFKVARLYVTLAP